MIRSAPLAKQLSEAQLWQIANRYRFVLRRSEGAKHSGQRSNTQSRMGRDFHGYVPYRVGEDVRHVDWPVFARTGDLYVRRYDDESVGRIILVIDVSGSMNVPTTKKWFWTRQLATVLGFAALQAGHEVAVALCHRGDVFFSRPFHGRACAAELFAFLTAHKPAGEASLAQAAQALSSPEDYGRIIFFSDFMLAAKNRKRLSWVSALAARCCLVRVLAPDELSVDVDQISDPESSRRHIFGPGRRREFQSLIEAFERDFHAAVSERNIEFIDLRTDVVFDAACTKLMQHFSALGSRNRAV